MQKAKRTKATLRFEWSKDNSKQRLFIDYYPPIERNGKITRREFIARTITPLRTKSGEPILRKKGVFEAKETDVVTGNVLPRIPKKFDGEAKFYSYNNTDEEAIIYGQALVADRQNQCSAYDNAPEAKRKQMFVDKQTSQSFESFFIKEMAKQKENTKRSFECALNWFNKFERDVLQHKATIADITQETCEMYRNYIEDSYMKPNSKYVYFGKFKQVVETLNKKRLIEYVDIKGFHLEETERGFLTLEELKILASTPYKHENIKRMCLFSAMTGLRISDLTTLRWGDIEETKDGIKMHIRTRKTNAKLDNYISQEAFEFCGERGEKNDLIFPIYTSSLIYTAKATTANNFIAKWVRDAGINKKVSCHTFRHTFAVLQLEQGTSIETIRELMGHKNLNTTLIYAKVLDDKKKKASKAISLK